MPGANGVADELPFFPWYPQAHPAHLPTPPRLQKYSCRKQTEFDFE
jgi:hypothetical protein